MDGRLQIRSYEGQDGQKRTMAEVIAENVRFLSPKEDDARQMNMTGQRYGNEEDTPW